MRVVLHPLKKTSNGYKSLVQNPDFNPFPKRQIFNFCKLKDFADSHFIFNKNGKKLIKREENTVGKGDITC